MWKNRVNSTLERQRRNRKLRTQPHTSAGNGAGRRNPGKDSTGARLSWVLAKKLEQEQSSCLRRGSTGSSVGRQGFASSLGRCMEEDPCLHRYGIIFIVTVSSFPKSTCQTLVLASHSAQQRFKSTATSNCYHSDILQTRCILQLALTVDIMLPPYIITDIWCTIRH